MTVLEEFKKKHEDIKTQLASIELPNGEATSMCGGVAFALGITGQTVRNYLSGDIKDGFLAVAIYKEFKKMKSKN